MDKSNEIKSPITQGSVSFLFEINKSELIKNYAKETNIDINYLLKNNDSIAVYQCNDTGYRFFYPFDIAGDGKFYEKLESIPWYYAEWKWDYDVAQHYINPNSHVLDIGCGEGKFIRFLEKEKQCTCVGLELNEKAQAIGVGNKLHVVKEFIQTHAQSNQSVYDTVTFFQVLEHIEAIDSFMRGAIPTVKPGGKIIIAVPNNEPYFLTYDKEHFLNLPPHHMGWWNEQSLSALAKVYSLELVDIIKQPLQHYTAYAQAFLTYRCRFPRGLVNLLTPIFKGIFYLNRKNIHGASILAVYKKK